MAWEWGDAIGAEVARRPGGAAKDGSLREIIK